MLAKIKRPGSSVGWIGYAHCITMTSPRGTMPSRKKPSRTALFVYNRCTASKLALLALKLSVIWMIGCIVLWLFRHTQCYVREAGVVWKEAPIHSLVRDCPPPRYDILQSQSTPPNICMTTLTDRRQPNWWQRLVRCRDFSSVQTITFPNHAAYAAKHKYTIIDASNWIDPSRPPAWSKIQAVKRLLTLPEHYDCDWVMWMDADTLIMDSQVKLESLLPAGRSIDLILTEDHSFAYSSGVWLIRKSAWSLQFLDDWWNSKGYIRSAGLSLSGDNAAFGHLVQQRVSNDKTINAQPHIAIPARCNLNSFAVFLTETQLQAVQRDPSQLQQAPWYMSDQFYHRGDFIAHAAGVDQKAAVVELLLKRAV